jgi:hypothetical protein
MTADGGLLRPLGFFLMMAGFGLRLDTPWQGTAWFLLAGGGACIALGLWRDSARAFVPPRGGE